LNELIIFIIARFFAAPLHAVSVEFLQPT